VIAGLLAAIAAVVLTSCAPSTPSVPRADDLTGTWHGSDDRGTLVLSEHGSGSADRLYLDGRYATGPLSWRVGDFSGRIRAGDGSPIVGVAFGATSDRPGYRVLLEVDGDGADRALVKTIDPDRNERAEFHR
jgi:hypothetical protein